MAGRKPKFSEEIVKELCTLHENGLPKKSCAKYVGIDRGTLYNWIQKGKKAKSGKYKEFYDQWLKAEAKYELHHLNKINKSPSWMSSQYLLQVHDPDTYVIAEKQKLEADLKADMKVESNKLKDAQDIIMNPKFVSMRTELLNDLIKQRENEKD